MTSDLPKLERLQNIKFNNFHLLKEAMTHKSFAAEHRIAYDNQRLELLGDAVVQIILTRYLYDRYPKLKEGTLTKIRSAVVNQDSLALFARSIELGNYLMLGKGEIELNGNDRDSTISDAFEALVGAIYLDQGLPRAEEFVLSLLNRHFPDPVDALDTLNPKGALQELTQRIGAKVPHYQVVDISGPDHDPQYSVEISILNNPLARASAGSRKQAENKAAEIVLNLLKSGDSSLPAVLKEKMELAQ